MNTTHNESFEKLIHLIKKIEFAMLTTVDDDGTLRSRPMATQKTDDFAGDLWFFTRASSAKVAEVEEEHQVNLAYADLSENTYVSVSGLARLVLDKTKAKELWSPAMLAWFPKGVEDPETALLKVTIEKAEYWDMPGNTLVRLLGFAKAVATCERYDPGENIKLAV